MALEFQEGLKRTLPYPNPPPGEELEFQEGLKRVRRMRYATGAAVLAALGSQEGLKSCPGWARIHAGPPGGRISVGIVNGVRRR
jgi:hypothetical protein